METLPFVWYCIIGFVVIMYVILDGFDLGIGILSMFVRDPKQRDLMVSAILPVWDGNETWLVLGGAMLYGAFPKAFATILPVLYIPLILMVVSLLFRGITFEFRLKAHGPHRGGWEIAFFLGSLIAALIQGLVVGTFVQGITLGIPGDVDISAANPMHYQWLTPFSLMCGFAMVFGYLLLGANWLIAKTHGELQDFCYHVSKFALVAVAFFMFIISFWTPFVDAFARGRWFSPEFLPYVAFLPLASFLMFVLHWLSLQNRKHAEAPFWYSIGIFLTGYLGFGISTFPYIVPHMITFTDAAAPSGSLKFMLVGTCIMLPILLFYTFYSYRIFRGKVQDITSY